MSDIVDGLQVTLTLSLFHYKPYSLDFAYRGSSGKDKVSAQDSQAFNDYLDLWIEKNLTNPKILETYPALTPWKDQQSGSFTFEWREYGVIPKGTRPSPKFYHYGGAAVARAFHRYRRGRATS